jgi:drug/metabolite transporter (DMT)-like permease
MLGAGVCEVGSPTASSLRWRTMPIADATAVLFVFPVLLIALAAVVLRERSGRGAGCRRGRLAGVLIILRPGTAAGTDPAMVWPLAAALFVAGRDLATRFVRPGASSGAVALSTTLLTTAAGLLTLPSAAGRRSTARACSGSPPAPGWSRPRSWPWWKARASATSPSPPRSAT